MTTDAPAHLHARDATAHVAARHDPEARLAELARAAGPLRRALAAVAGRLVACGGWRRLGYARSGDYARERLGRSSRSLQDWARVDRRLAELPGLERALVGGTLAWSQVRLLARVATPENEGAWISRARTQSVRTLAREVRAANRSALEAGAAPAAEEDEATAWVRIPASPAVCIKWQRMRSAAPKVAGQRLPPGAVLEMVTAEVLSALPLVSEVDTRSELEVGADAAGSPDPAGDPDRGSALGSRTPPVTPNASAASAASGSHDAAVPPSGACALPAFLRPLVEGLDDADPFELDARLRRAMRLEQRLEAELGPLLRHVSAPEYEWRAEYTSLAAFAHEQLGLSPRKLRALLRVERAGDACAALRAAYRDGRLSWLQAQWLARLVEREAEGAWRERWVAFAQSVTVRCLEEVVEAALTLREGDPEAWGRFEGAPEQLAAHLRVEAAGEAGGNTAARQVCAPTGDREADTAWAIAMAPAARSEATEGWRLGIAAPADVAQLFRATLCSLQLAIERETGRLPSPGTAFEAMLDHAARSWGLEDAWLGRRKPAAVRIFERDGWRCTVPGCTSQRHLQAHHIRFRSRGGSDAPANLTTLCAFHHQRGVHAGVVGVRGHAPDGLVFELGCRPGQPPLARYRSGDRVA